MPSPDDDSDDTKYVGTERIDVGTEWTDVITERIDDLTPDFGGERPVERFPNVASSREDDDSSSFTTHA